MPFLLGGAGGGLAGMFGGGRDRQEFGRLYPLRNVFMTPAQQRVSDDMSYMRDRQANAAMEAARSPISPETWYRATKATLDNLLDMPGALLNWGESLRDSQEHLRAFSGLMANTFAEAEVRQMMRNFDSAQRTGASTQNLSRALDDILDTIQPYRDLFTNISNTVVAIAIKMGALAAEVAKSVTWLDEIAGILNRWFDKEDKSKPGAFEFMDNIRNLPDQFNRKPRK